MKHIVGKLAGGKRTRKPMPECAPIARAALLFLDGIAWLGASRAALTSSRSPLARGSDYGWGFRCGGWAPVEFTGLRRTERAVRARCRNTNHSFLRSVHIRVETSVTRCKQRTAPCPDRYMAKCVTRIWAHPELNLVTSPFLPQYAPRFIHPLPGLRASD